MLHRALLIVASGFGVVAIAAVLLASAATIALWTFRRRLFRQNSVLMAQLSTSREALQQAQNNAREAEEARAQLEDQLRQSQKLEAVGQLAGGIAHDFNNLLTVIRGHSELLSAAIDHADPKSEGIREIYDASRRAAALTRQLLAFTRKQVLEPRIISVDDEVSHLVPMLKRLIGEDIQIVLRLCDDPTNVMADPSQLDQVLINLAVNARDAMVGGGTLSIATSTIDADEHDRIQHEAIVPGPYVLITVSDTGSGMDDSVRARVFEPFFTTKPPSEGCGLGLSTVYGIVKHSGGYIWVHSAPNEGTTFKIYLPAAAADATMSELSTPPWGMLVSITEMRGGTETVLLVEDDDALRSFGRQVLARQGYTVLDAANGHDALHLAKLHDGPLHLVVTDMIMPGMGGRVLTEKLLALRPTVRALYMSGYAQQEIAGRGGSEASAVFLAKPFTAAGLLHAVRHVLETETDSVPNHTNQIGDARF